MRKKEFEIEKEVREEMEKRNLDLGKIFDLELGTGFVAIFLGKGEELKEIRIPRFVWEKYNKEERKGLYDFLVKYTKGELEEKFVKDLYTL